MSRRSRSSSGFSVIEALVSVLILVIVMALTMSLLFGMRAFASRQQSFMAPRQSARAAIDYLSFYLEGAGDLNVARNNPNALLMYLIGESGGMKQASYNDVKDTRFADAGTDIVTLAIPTRPIVAPIVDWTGKQHSADLHVRYTAGCPGDLHDVYSFELATGASPAPKDGSPPTFDNKAKSELLMIADDNGNWAYFVITDYKAQDADCSGAKGWNLHIIANSGGSGEINPPGGQPLMKNPRIMCGVEFKSFRVRNRTLEQKNGIFDADQDTPYPADPDAARFNPVMENVEDLQVAYIYGAGAQAGTIWNTGSVDAGGGWKARTLDPTLNGIPSQQGYPAGTAPEWDVANVVGLRLSVTARSTPLALSSMKLASFKTKTAGANPSVAHYYRPASEDHAEAAAVDYVPGPNPLVYDHVRLTTTLMLRNRMLGN